MCCIKYTLTHITVSVILLNTVSGFMLAKLF